ncbi:helix-turn-helix transcriptional regulator [Lysinibacter sp. HNR]|uniref:helix-turn-helix domain-containing protein n=1 Tax=Lysinibacter sp. HNR TaxID=3031408 RepID=UPI002435C1FE|nr:helix-turn-helix transcriptional regulator [Lysinibacter sp. HNR]WGD36821.1 helix-turn-helix transcriptional regulator [Lysinibacter sp. HNR]
MAPREPEPPVSEFASAVADGIQNLIDSREMSARELARRIKRSNNYMGIRLRKEAAFTLTDIDRICVVLEIDPGSFLAGIHAARGSNVVPLARAANVETEASGGSAWTAEAALRIENFEAQQEFMQEDP